MGHTGITIQKLHLWGKTNDQPFGISGFSPHFFWKASTKKYINMSSARGGFHGEFSQVVSSPSANVPGFMTCGGTVATELVCWRKIYSHHLTVAFFILPPGQMFQKWGGCPNSWMVKKNPWKIPWNMDDFEIDPDQRHQISVQKKGCRWQDVSPPPWIVDYPLSDTWKISSNQNHNEMDR